MRNLKGLIWICVVAMAGATAYADLIIDNESILSSAEISSVAINPNNGNISITTLAPGAVVVNLTTSKANVDVNQYATISWTTENATSCVPSGGTGGWKNKITGVPSGSKNILFQSEGIFDFVLTCSDGATDQGSDTVRVTAGNPTVEDACAGYTSPLGGNVVNWNTFWGINFPYPVSTSVDTNVPRNGYLAIKFNTGSVLDEGYFGSVESTATSGTRYGSVSSCPGDYAVAPECDYIWGSGGTLGWSTNGTAGTCQLDPQTDYYFNITFTDGFVPANTACIDTNCVATLRHYNFE